MEQGLYTKELGQFHGVGHIFCTLNISIVNSIMKLSLLFYARKIQCNPFIHNAYLNYSIMISNFVSSQNSSGVGCTHTICGFT